MKILLLSQPESNHTLKIANSLCREGHEVFVLGYGNDSLRTSYDEKVKYFNFTLPDSLTQKGDGNLSKLIYFKLIPAMKRIIKGFKPDIINAHYASSYGLLAKFINYHPYVVSVWGSDIYEFPNKSVLFKTALKSSLNSADAVFSTSKDMAKVTAQYTRRPITVTPFGIDTKRFASMDIKEKEYITVGIIKSLEEWRGIAYLIEGFALLCKKRAENIRLVIVGRGSMEKNYKKMAEDLGIKERVNFKGQKSPDEIERYHNLFDISCYPSLKESFGVSILESQACEVPVVASRIGGIPETLIDGVTGYLVAPADPEAIADNLEKLVADSRLREKMGKAGREFVIQNYEWEDSIRHIINSYESIIKTYS
ncbi:MAG: glycosyltransferase [Ignavibacteriaceae bacterium]